MTKKPAAQPPALAPETIEPRDQVMLWLLHGQTDADIRTAAAAKWPKENADQLIGAAVEHFALAAKCDRDVLVGWGMEACRALYQRMLEIGDYANALKAVKELVGLTKYLVHPETEPPADDDGQTLEEHPAAAVGPNRADTRRRPKKSDPRTGPRRRRAKL